VTITIPVNGHDVTAAKLVKRGTLTFSASYPTGGESFTPAQFGLISLDQLDVHPTSGYAFEVDYTNRKVLVRYGGISAHTHTLHFQTGAAANAVTAAANQLRTGAAAFDVAGVNDSSGEGGVVRAAGAPGSEVANGTNLSGVTAQFVAVGV
jgi:hypothetical protein